jgi:hypothetical protein
MIRPITIESSIHFERQGRGFLGAAFGRNQGCATAHLYVLSVLADRERIDVQPPHPAFGHLLPPPAPHAREKEHSRRCGDEMFLLPPARRGEKVAEGRMRGAALVKVCWHAKHVQASSGTVSGIRK